jgi:hypothetical protein
MIERERLANYLDSAPDAGLEAELANDAQAFGEWVAQHRTDRLLRSLLASQQEIRDSILSAVEAPSLDDLKTRVLKDVSFPWWRIGWGIGLAAALVVVVLVLLPRPRSTVQVGNYTGPATVRLADGTQLTLHRGAELRVESADGKQLTLTAGQLDATVRHQPAGQPLVVRTPLATLRVLGTAFALDTGPQRTRLEVREGLVRVEHAQQDSTVEVAAGEFVVAAPQTELVAGVLPVGGRPGGSALPTERVFSDDSPWNQPLGKVRYVDIESPVFDLAGHGASVVPASHFQPVWVAQAGDPPRRMVSRYEDRVLETVPAPSIGERRPMGTLVDPVKAVAYELVAPEQRGEDIEVADLVRHDLRGPGIPPEQCGRLWSGLPMIAGIIRAGELEKGIRHALSVFALHAGLNRHAGNGQPFVWPARHMPIDLRKLEYMGTTGNVCYGTRLAIPRDVDLSGFTGPALAIARALQTYGAFVVHSYPTAPNDGQGWKQPHLQFCADEPMDSTDWQRLGAEVSKVVLRLKVVTP